MYRISFAHRRLYLIHFRSFDTVFNINGNTWGHESQKPRRQKLPFETIAEPFFGWNSKI